MSALAKPKRGTKHTREARGGGVPRPGTTGEKLERDNGAGSATTQFKPGAEWRGNAKGRPKGSRNKINQVYLDAMQVVVTKEDAVKIMTRVLREDPVAFMKLWGQLQPKQTQEVKPIDEMDEAELAEYEQFLLKRGREAAAEGTVAE